MRESAIRIGSVSRTLIVAAITKSAERMCLCIRSRVRSRLILGMLEQYNCLVIILDSKHSHEGFGPLIH